MLLIHIFTALSVFHLCTAVKTCNESEAESFNFHAILGRWFAVGVAYEGKGKITDSPKARIPDPEENMCFMLEFVKTDESELKQYLQNFPNAKERSDIFEVIKGVRLHMKLFGYLESPQEHIWWRIVEGSESCFEDALIMTSDNKFLYRQLEGRKLRGISQFHLINGESVQAQYMVQTNGETSIKGVIYRRTPGQVSRQELDPALKKLHHVQSNMTLTRLCLTTPNVLVMNS